MTRTCPAGHLVWSMIAVFTLLAGAVLGYVSRLLLDRKTETRAARRALYVDMLADHSTRRRVLALVAAGQDIDLTEYQGKQAWIDSLNARLAIDATPKVREIAKRCNELVAQISTSHGLGIRLTVDAVAGKAQFANPDADEAGNEGLRQVGVQQGVLAAYQLYGDLLEKLEDCVRRELHGRMT